MSADADNGDAPDGDEDVSFDLDAVRSRLPAGLTDKQQRAMICAVRNPDARFNRIAKACGVNYATVEVGLQSLASGIIGESPGGEWIRNRNGEKRHAETFEELTDKQQAVIEFLARHPDFSWRRHTGKDLHQAIQANLDDPPAMTPTYPKKVAENYESLVEERRDQLLAMGEDLAGEVDTSDVFDPDTPREYLEAAGVTELPDRNLDSLDAPGDTAAVPEDATLDEFEQASSLDDDGDDLAVPVENHLFEDRGTFDDDDVTPGTVYEGVVNGLSDWGVWVTIGGDPDDPGDVSGVVPKEKLARAGKGLDDYRRSDTLRVVATGRSNTSDGKVRHRFALPTAESVETPQGDESHGEPRGGVAAGDGGGETATASNAATGPTGDDSEDAPDTVEVPSEQLAALVERVRAVETAVDRTEARVEQNAEALPDEDTARQLNEAADTVLSAADDLEALAERLDTVEDRVNTLDEGFRDLAESVDSLDDRLATVENRTSGHTESLKDVRGILDDHATEREGLAERVEDLEAERDEVTLVDAIGALEDAGVAYEVTARNDRHDTETDHE